MFELVFQIGEAYYSVFAEPTPMSPDECSAAVAAHRDFVALLTETTGQYVRLFCEAKL